MAAVATTTVVDPKVQVAKYFSAAIAMGASALGAAYAQAKIGSAAAGTLAENPDAGAMLLVLQALPEIIVLLGFVSALIIVG
ncbi:MAG: ATPase [Coriobacteriia bacterium]|nr:ATPase [Coriobacteriia bacterium]